ncbi:histone-fold-containing protein [Tilletiopsis washingtonensis]|uniref:Histone-fold-containing protein n=1 Tax=Tilletiopsis washingtonensis TaxID=58919 RepID=A0A316Z0B6_9BASI|nr:histone-fold-containing protein [Tilletiopsis washingtonensis]PWN94921.1 histone-fold-containing protein [Tilletiopsis washingtonensis]
MGKRSGTSKFPVARIKKIMQSNEEVGKVAQATPVLISKALELFMAELIDATVKEAKAKGAKRVAPHHLKRAVHKSETLDFCKAIVGELDEGLEEDKAKDEGAARGGKRRKVATAAADA